MTITMNILHIKAIPQMIDFLARNRGQPWDKPKILKKEIYEWLSSTLIAVDYRRLRKKQKRVVKRFIRKVTGYSDIQIKRLISKYKQGRLIWKPWQCNESNKIYTPQDIDLLHQVD